LHWAAATLKGPAKFQNKKNQTTLHHHAQLKNVDFKIRDPSPLILGVPAGVIGNIVGLVFWISNYGGALASQAPPLSMALELDILSA